MTYLEISQSEFIEYLSDENEGLEEDKKRLKHRLAEKDKEIGKLTRRLNLTTKYKDDQKERANKYYDEIKQLRKQICKEIKESIIYLTGYETEKEARAYNCELNAREVLDEIDKIEQVKGDISER